MYKISFVDLGENLFGSKLIKLCSAQDLIICNGLTKWPNSNQMTCIHGLGSSVLVYIIYGIPLYNKMTNLDILNNHEPNSYHRPLIVTLNFFMNSDPIGDNSHDQKNLIFDKNKDDFFLNDLKNDLVHLSSTNNIEDLYHNFTMVLSPSINKFYIAVLGKKRNRKMKP